MMTKSSPRAEELNELLTFFLFELHLFIVCVHVLYFPFLFGRLRLLLVSVYLWRLEDSSVGLALSLHHGGPGIKLRFQAWW